MYLWSQEQDMPLSPGLLWTKTNYGFRKQVLEQRTSFSAVQWLQWEQTKCGTRIQNAYFQGEKMVHGYLVDGFAIINGVETVWEYNGCSFHGCPCIKNRSKDQIQKYQKWLERKAKMESNGCTVNEMWCCRWRKMRKLIKKNPPKTELGRILCSDNQEIFRNCKILYSCTILQKCRKLTIFENSKVNFIESNQRR